MKIINTFEISSLIYFIMRYSLVGITINNLILLSKQDSYISLIIGFVLGFIPIKLYMYIMDYNIGLNFPELIKSKFNKFTANIINTIFIIFIFIFSVTIFWNLTNLINSQYLSLTPKLFIGIVFLLPTVYLLLKDIPVIAKSVVIFFYISLILTIIPFLGLISEVELNNFLPLLNNPISNILNGSYQYLTFNVIPLFLLTIIPKDSVKDYKRLNKRFYKCYLLFSIITFSFLFLTIGIFGEKLAQLYQYPEFHLLKHVSIAGFFQRLESTLSIQWIFDIFTINLLCIYYILTTINCTFNIKKDKFKTYLVYIIPLASLIISLYIFPNNTSGNKFFLETFSTLLFIFMFAIPLIIIFIIKFKDLKLNNL